MLIKEVLRAYQINMFALTCLCSFVQTASVILKGLCSILTQNPRGRHKNFDPMHSFLARLYLSTGRVIAVTTASASALVLQNVKRQYLMNLWMDLVDTLPDVRYWSEVLCCTTQTHFDDFDMPRVGLEVKI